MNEELLETIPNETNPEPDGPTPAQAETAENADSSASPCSAEERSDTIEDRLSSNTKDPLFPEDPGKNSDPDPGVAEATDAPSALDELRNELKQLREEMGRRDRVMERMGLEYEEFQNLYPDVSLSALPDSVWEDVHRGVPLAAAYALAERKKKKLEEVACISNQQNANRSAGPLSALPSEYFSPAEVRAMSRDEVRANYKKIMRSIQKWH